MAGGQTQVDIAGMRAAIPQFQQAMSETKQAMDAMTEQRGTLIGGGGGQWAGDAATTFAGAIDEWENHAAAVYKALEDMYHKLEQTTGKYQNVHGDTSDTASSVRNSMGSQPLPGM